VSQAIVQKLRGLARTLESQFLGKQETIRLMVLSVLAGEHIALIGPPGTAKSALVRNFARMIDSRYFEYLLTRFSEPNELFGPVDIPAFRQGTYRRRTEGMLPDAEIVFLDEIFKSNSAILNALLTLLNERKFNNGGSVVDVPLLSVFGASNEVPADESLQAIFDRFLLRVRNDQLDAYHFQELIGAAWPSSCSASASARPSRCFSPPGASRGPGRRRAAHAGQRRAHGDVQVPGVSDSRRGGEPQRPPRHQAAQAHGRERVLRRPARRPT
jgi:hypothetical protein